ncbi:MAG: 50S ribosome-binding GTPase [Bifidobacteriaceae bacterium]|jgi:hypothetical protein|nr:50S ribosome-binding GTPase [Bifidobacteriaceae bacterium]
MSQSAPELVRQGIADLREAAQLSARRLDHNPAALALGAAARIEERLDLGVDHTVAVLQGGTGSGKSALFNAIAEMDFAEVSAVRPTTHKATACVWGPGAGPLLDWLGVSRDAQIQRDSVLEAHIDELRGLILVDVPDYDSVADDHQQVADRLLLLADVLVWVTDPQKYADPALHERFAAVARAHPGHVSLVVLNQLDTVAPEAGRAIEAALTDLLVEAGLTDPIVASVSAATGAGVAALRTWLMAQTAHQTTALRRLAVGLGTAAWELAQSADVLAPGQLPDAVRSPSPGGAATVDAQFGKHLPDAVRSPSGGPSPSPGGAAADAAQPGSQAGDAAQPGSQAADAAQPGSQLADAAQPVGAAAGDAQPRSQAADAAQPGSQVGAGAQPAVPGHPGPGAQPAVPARLGAQAAVLARPSSGEPPDSAGWIGLAAATVVNALLEACAPAPTVALPLDLGANQTRAATSLWVAEAARHLPQQWATSVSFALGSPANIATRLADALDPLELPPRPGFWARWLRPGKAARARRADWEARLRAAISPVVDRTMTRPTEGLLQDRRQLRALLSQVLEASQEAASRPRR